MARNLVMLGGGGFIGSSYYSLFASEFNKVTIVDRFDGPSHSTLAQHSKLRSCLRPQDRLFTADAGDIHHWPELLREASHVFILNADTGTGSSFTHPSMTVDQNLGTLAKLVESIRSLCSEQTRVLFTSSRAVYGEGHWRCREHGNQTPDRSITALTAGRFEPRCPRCGELMALEGSKEDDLLHPLSVYGLSKASGEQLLALTLSNTGFDVRIVRYQNVYGIGQAVDNPYTGVLNWFSQELLRGNPVRIYERAHIVRDFIFVDDAAMLLHRLALSNRPGGAGPSPYIVNGGSGIPTVLADAAAMLKHIYGSDSEIVHTNDFRPGDVLGAVADMARARHELDYEARTPLADGLARYASWFRKQVLEDK